MTFTRHSRWVLRLVIAIHLSVPFLSTSLDAAERNSSDAASPQAKPGSGQEGESKRGNYKISGRCIDFVDRSPIAGIAVQLFIVEGMDGAPVSLAFAMTDAKGEFEFKDLQRPRPEQLLDRLNYQLFAFDKDRPVGVGFRNHGRQPEYEIPLGREATTLSGRVIDQQGKPVAGADVMNSSVGGRPVEGILSTRTDADGRFEIDRIAVYRNRNGDAGSVYYQVIHPDFPKVHGEVKFAAGEVTVVLKPGCIVSGKAVDQVTKQPIAGAVISAQQMKPFRSEWATTDASGQFRLALEEGTYSFTAMSKDRVFLPLIDQECLAGETNTLPTFEMIEGGFISGQVIDTSTKKPVVFGNGGEPIAIGVIGPCWPREKALSPNRLTSVDESGRFRIRVAPGDNFPYFVNIQGNRMAWDTCNQPAIVVKAGETTTADLLITPPLTPAEKMQKGQAVVDALPKASRERTARILEHFRTVPNDDTETWCLLMRELVGIGKTAVPQLCEELDKTTANMMLRRLGFALRAIGDPRAVPALIRAIPRTLLPSSSDYGLLVADPNLTAFMQQHDLDERSLGTHFGFGRPVREIFGALHKLTSQNFDDAELFSISRSEDPRRQVLQRRLLIRQAERWQKWWDANGRSMTGDPNFERVKLVVADEELPPVSTKLESHSRFDGGVIGATLSPATQEGQHARHFYDFDTGYQPKWPVHIPKDESRLDKSELEEWALNSGVDVMCITHRAPGGTETYVLRAMGMKVREISPRDVRNLEKLIDEGTLPEGRPVDELLIHYDPESKTLVPNANGAFIGVTREGTIVLIEVTDRVTKTADVTGQLVSTPGVGFFLGVKFNLKPIIGPASAAK